MSTETFKEIEKNARALLKNLQHFALIINGENDVLRDEGEAYPLKLLEADVPVTAVRYHGTIHDFVMLNVITDDPAPRAAIDQASFTLNRILTK